MSICSLALATSAARAQDFMITAPVVVAKLPPNVKTLTVSCQVTAPRSGMGMAVVIGKGASAPQAVPSDGAFKGEIRVPVTATPGADKTKAEAYDCRLYFTATDPVTGGNVDYFRWDDPTLGASPPRQFPTTAGAALTLESKGPLPPAP